MKNKTVRLFLLAIILRLLVMPFTFHPDIKVYSFQSSFLSRGVFNIYDYLLSHRNELPLKEEFVYQPLTYLFLGSYQVLVTPISGDLKAWLWDSSSRYIENPHLFYYLFWLKLPILIFDLLIAFVLYKNYREGSKKDLVWYWLFNPFTITLLYVYSNVDIFALLFFLLAWLLHQKGKWLGSAVMLGIGAGFKMFPLLFLPLLLSKRKNIKELFFCGSVVLITFGLILTPFVSQAMLQSSVVSGLSTRLFQGHIELGFGESIYPAVVGLMIVYLISFINKKISLENLGLMLFLTLYSTIHYHIQWLLWGAPFAIIIWLKNEKLRSLLLLTISVAFLIPLMYNDKFMTASLFTPVSPLFALVPTPFAIIQRVFDPYVFTGILHSVLLAFSVLVGYELVKDEQH